MLRWPLLFFPIYVIEKGQDGVTIVLYSWKEGLYVEMVPLVFSIHVIEKGQDGLTIVLC